ncbi:MAG: DUF3685 domain-containing protein [Okeania sp. SIO3I5]|uniref:DUF3685 domain-containing protein n=1 Tax=Okeania sp. SIO3I5 TaxID=2607805 RepID=UPI0013B93C81|nr:DUF3685 domain-containing protein [Okeania sp. SIO3I5]NEQ34833.1 DUF3685 domain-containing protein [Okeania sp. SIO3I5]
MNSESVLKLLLIDNDSIFRMGLKFSFEQFSDIEIVVETEVGSEALKFIQNLNKQENKFFVILDIETNNLLPQNSEEITISGIDFCQQLKTSCPELQILLLTSLQDTLLLTFLRELGVNGYCQKGISISELIIIIRQIANGEFYWVNIPEIESIQESSEKPANLSLRVQTRNFFNTIFDNVYQSGIKQIDSSLSEVTSQLNERLENLDRNNLTSLLNVAITSGQRRELLTARWILSHLLPKSFNAQKQQQQINVNRDYFGDSKLQKITELPTNKLINSANNNRATIQNRNAEVISQTSTETTNVQTALFEATIAKLNANLINFSGLPMEIDILRGYKKQELIYIALCKFEDILDELRSASILMEEIPKQKYEIVHNLWQLTSQVFLDKYYQLEITNGIGTVNYFSEKIRVEVMPVLFNETDNVHKFILDKIPLVEELISYLLFEVPLVVDNVSFAVGSPEAMERSEALLQNLLISVANGVMQPLLNNFAHVEEIKEHFYDRQLLSTRDIEKFRNQLSWKYRIEEYIGEPKAIFESNFFLFVLNERGIKKISIYSPRRHELGQLSGIPLTVTLLLETRDAIAPGIKATVSFIGSGVVYLLTQVIGRGIGLIGRGIIQGVGSSFQDVKFGRNNNTGEARKSQQGSRRQKGSI